MGYKDVCNIWDILILKKFFVVFLRVRFNCASVFYWATLQSFFEDLIGRPKAFF